MTYKIEVEVEMMTNYEGKYSASLKCGCMYNDYVFSDWCDTPKQAVKSLKQKIQKELSK